LNLTLEEYRVILELLQNRKAGYVFPENDEDRIAGIVATNLYRAGLLYWRGSPSKHNGNVYGVTRKGYWESLRFRFSKEHQSWKRQPWEAYRPNEIAIIVFRIAFVLLTVLVIWILY